MNNENHVIVQYEVLVGHLRAQIDEMLTRIEELQTENEQLRVELEKKSAQKKATKPQGRGQTYGGFGETHTNAEWARRLKVPRNSLWRNLQAGRSVEEYAAMRRIKYP